MACPCSAPCNCPVVSVAPAVIGEPGPSTELTADVTILPSTDSASVQTSGVPPTQHLQFLLPAAPSPVLSVAATNTLPAGDPAAVAINNTDPLAPALTFSIPAGAAGADGVSPFTSLDASFVQPAAGSTVTVTVADTSWMSLGGWAYVSGGGHYVIASNPLSATQILLRNPGAGDLSPFGWTLTSIPTNAAPGATITSSGFDNQVEVSGPPGAAGEEGAAGATLDPSVVYVVPSSPPSGPEDYLRVYFNAAPPSVPTVGQFYTWNGAAWVAGPNFVSQGGTTTYSGTADPNTAPPAGSKVLDLYIQFIGDNAVYWQRTSPSTWVVIGTVALMGTTTVEETHTVAGTLTLPAENFSYLVDANKDIDLAFDDTNYAGQGTWTVVIYNSDASSIDFTAGTLSTSGIPTLPLTIPTLTNAVVVVRKAGSTAGSLPLTRYVIEQAYIPS